MIEKRILQRKKDITKSELNFSRKKDQMNKSKKERKKDQLKNEKKKERKEERKIK